MASTASTSEIDLVVMGYFASPPEGVWLPTNGLLRARRRRLGRSVIAMFDDEHWQHKRGHVPRAPDPVDMHRPFDAARFNFNRVDPREVVSRVNLCNDIHPVLVNVSPLMVGHTVVPLWAEQELPQGSLGRMGVRCMFELAAASERQDFRVVYNSLGAFASVNHLHVHGLYAGKLDGEESCDSFPVELAARRLIATAAAGVEVFALDADPASGHYVNGFVLEGPPQALAGAAGDAVQLLASMGVPHNLLVRMRPSPACFLLPRRPQECFDVAGVGCNAAVCELCGFLVMQSLEAYEGLTLQKAHSAFREGASLRPADFEELGRRCCQELGWRGRRSLAARRAAAVVLGLGGVLAAAAAYPLGRRPSRP